MIFVILALLNLIFIFNLSKLSKILNIYDIPDGKLKLHKKKTPIIGGIILIINFSIIFFYQIFFLNNFLSLKLETFQSLELLSLIILIYSYFFLGLYDDKYNLKPLKKLFLSILIILITTIINKNLVITNFLYHFMIQEFFLKIHH